MLFAVILLSASYLAFAQDKTDESVTASTGTGSDIQVSPTTTKKETDLGNETLKEIEKVYKFVDDPEMIKKVTDIANEIAPFTQRPGVVYKCWILDSPAYNAMAIPGGYLFITKGLLGAVETDDELAGVIAHEVAHNSLNHFERSAKHESRASMWTMIGVFMGILAGETADIGNLAVIGSITLQALNNGYTENLEREADTNAVIYLNKLGKYNASGLYTVMLGFKRIERERPPVYYGYLSTHPANDTRMRIIREQMARDGKSINVWISLGLRAKTKEDVFSKEELYLGDSFIYRFTSADSKERAKAAAESINKILIASDMTSVRPIDVKYNVYDNNSFADIIIARKTVFTITKDDAKEWALKDVARSITDNIKNTLLNEMMRRGISESDLR